MDNFDPDTQTRIQVKATCIEEYCTSFGPQTDYDAIIFVDFYHEEIKIYDLSKYIEVLKTTILNNKKNVTFEMQFNN